MKDLWPSASRFWHLIKPGLKRSKTQILTLSDPKIRGQEPKTLSKRAHNPLLKEAGLTKPTAAHPSGGPVAGGATGTSGMPLTASGLERPPDSDATLSFGSLCAHRSLNPRGNASAYTPAKPETVATPDPAVGPTRGAPDPGVRLTGGLQVTR